MASVRRALSGRSIFVVEQELRRNERIIELWTSRLPMSEHVTPNSAYVQLRIIASLKEELLSLGGP